MINPRLTRCEYWLLETVAELAIPIRWLDHKDLEIALNKPGHGMDRALLIETMQKLFSEGLITTNRLDDIEDDFVFTKGQLESALSEKLQKDQHYYCLTKKGGQYWEAFASPDWNYYIDSGFQPIENDEYWLGELICSKKDHLENYFNSLCYYQYDVDKNSIQRDTLEPWEATYWKELPMGYRIRFRCLQKEINYDSREPIETSWYDHKWYRWR